METKRLISIIAAGLLVAFGLLTLFLSSSIIFDWFGIRAKEGNYVLFVVGANFLCAILYLIAAYGFIKKKQWVLKVLLTALILLFVGFIGLFVHITMGGLYETKTIGAMIFRLVVTLGLIALAKKTTSK